MQKKLIFGLVILILTVGCNRQDETDKNKINAVVSIVTYKNFVEAIGGEDVSVNVLIPAGASPHTFELTSAQMKQISTSDVYFKVGGKFNFEQEVLEKISAGQSSVNIINCSKGIEFIDDNPHIWLGPPQVKQVTENILNELISLKPGRTVYYQNNFNNFVSRLDSLDLMLQKILKPFSKRNFFVYHEAWKYFAEPYGLNELAIEKEGKEPGVFYMQQIIDLAKYNDIKHVYISPNQNPGSAAAVAHEIGAEIDTLNTLPENYLSYLPEIINKLIRDFK
jgi:zinc transport system substrate-binding protein